MIGHEFYTEAAEWLERNKTQDLFIETGEGQSFQFSHIIVRIVGDETKSKAFYLEYRDANGRPCAFNASYVRRAYWVPRE